MRFVQRVDGTDLGKSPETAGSGGVTRNRRGTGGDLLCGEVVAGQSIVGKWTVDRKLDKPFQPPPGLSPQAELTADYEHSSYP